MELAAHNFTAQDAAGNILKGVSIEVRREVPGSPLVSLFSDVDGKTSLGNAFTSESGLGVFYVASGFYQIKTTRGSSTRTQRNVRIGTAGGYSIEEITGFAVGMSWKGGWQTSTAYNKTDVVENNGSAYFCIADHTSGSDDDEPGVGGNTATYWKLFVSRGARGIVWLGAWAAETPYALGSGVENNGTGYVCIQAHTSGNDKDQPGVGDNWQTYWGVIAKKGAGAAGLNWRGSWQDVLAYAPGDAVENGGSSYICNVAHGSIVENEPGVGEEWRTYWGVVAIKGETGADGIAPGLLYKFSSTTAIADPGAGMLRHNNADPESVTAIAIDDFSAEDGNPDVSALIGTWDDSTNVALRGTLTIKKRRAPENFATFNITGASTDNAGWTQLVVTYVDHAGTFSDADVITVEFNRTGDKGADGAGAGDVLMTFDAKPLSGFLELDGARISGGATTYPVITSRYPWMVVSGDIVLPDMRGEFARGWDHGRGKDPDAVARGARAGDGQTGDYPGTRQGDMYRSHAHTQRYSDTSGRYGGSRSRQVSGNSRGGGTTRNSGGNETRPTNLAFMFQMKAG